VSGLLDISGYIGMAVDRELDAREPAPWNLPIRHWSPSSLAMFQRCPRQWQERYLHGRKERPAEAPVIGIGLHHAAEVNFKQKIDSHEDIPLATLLDYYNSAFPVVVDQEQEKAGEEVAWDTSAEKAQKRGELMLAGYQNTVAPRIQPTDVELNISVDLGLPVPVEGRFDVERDETVIDIKSGKQAQRKPKEAWRIQAAVYGEARQRPVEFHSVSASPSRNTVTIITPLESEDMLVQPSPAQRASQSRTLRALSDYACFLMATVGPDDPWPTMGVFHSWACEYCGFRGDCPAWRQA